MIQKYTIFKDVENNSLIISELAIVNKVLRKIDYQNINSGDFSVVCREKYDSREIEIALSKNRHALISSIRTNNMYPIAQHAEAIADLISNLFKSTNSQTAELIFDDHDLLS